MTFLYENHSSTAPLPLKKLIIFIIIILMSFSGFCCLVYKKASITLNTQNIVDNSLLLLQQQHYQKRKIGIIQTEISFWFLDSYEEFHNVQGKFIAENFLQFLYFISEANPTFFFLLKF